MLDNVLAIVNLAGASVNIYNFVMNPKANGLYLAFSVFNFGAFVWIAIRGERPKS